MVNKGKQIFRKNSQAVKSLNIDAIGRENAHMTYWTHILTLLTFSVLIDNRVYKEEVDCFTEQALKIRALLNPEMLFSKKMAFDWFMAHRDEKKAQLKSDKFELHILESVMALSAMKGRHQVLAAMDEVVQSDGELHNKEVNLIALTKANWGL